MTDFGNLKEYEVTAQSTARCELFQLRGSPVLIVRPATQTNDPYFSASLRGAGIRRMARKAKSGILSPKMLEEIRDRDRALFPKHVITGWENVRDVDGADVTFSLAACKEFIEALPPDMFDEVREFAGDLVNFRADVVDPEEVAKNSASDSSGNSVSDATDSQ